MLIEFLIIWVKLIQHNRHHLFLNLKLIKLILLTKKLNHSYVPFVHILLEIFMIFKHILQNIQKKIFDVYYVIACNCLHTSFSSDILFFLFKGISIDEIVLHI